MHRFYLVRRFLTAPRRAIDSDGSRSRVIYHVLDIRTDIRPTFAEIDLSALRRNAQVLAACVAPAKLLAVVKADAYGHGAMACARALEPLVWGFAVSLVEEGVELRRGGIDKEIVVLGGVYGRAHQDVVAYRLIPVLSEIDDLRRFARAADDLNAGRVEVHINVDTGMSRLGARLDRLPALLEAARATAGVEVTGLHSHLYDADGADESATREQLLRFDEARRMVAQAGLRPSLFHVANTAGAARFPEARLDLVRPGLALFGSFPSPRIAPYLDAAGAPTLRPVMRLCSRIVALRDVPEGTTVSYGGAFRASRPSRIATIPIGYADGYTRRLSGRAEVLVAGRRCKLAGNVTMDMSMIDVSDVTDANGPVQLGDEVVLIGEQSGQRITVEELAEHAGTISWEIFCGISKRVPRVYLNGNPATD
jgi:alanine racemase